MTVVLSDEEKAPVAFTGLGRQAAIAGVLAGGWPGRLAPNVAAGCSGLRITGFGGGFWQVGAAGDDGFATAVHRFCHR